MDLPETINCSALTDDEYRHLFRQICDNALGPIDLAEAALVARWCDDVMQKSALVDGIRLGEVAVRWPKDAPQPLFSLTAKGLTRLMQLAVGLTL